MQRPAQIGQRQPVAGQFGGIEQHPHHPIRRTDGVQVAGTGNALQFGFQGMRHPAQIVGATLRVFGPQRQGDDRHVVDALGLDDGLTNSKVGRQPIEIGVELVVQADNGVGAGLADQELHGQHRHAGSRHRIHMFDALDFREHLLGRAADQSLHLAGGGAGEGDEHIGEGHVDLRFFLARGDQHREHAHQQPHQRQQRGDFAEQEFFRDRPG